MFAVLKAVYQTAHLRQENASRNKLLSGRFVNPEGEINGGT